MEDVVGPAAALPMRITNDPFRNDSFSFASQWQHRVISQSDRVNMIEKTVNLPCVSVSESYFTGQRRFEKIFNRKKSLFLLYLKF